jgi:D-arabinose 1-dehydrogenase-like Zn-dependent alcohol dehydrogenase
LHLFSVPVGLALAKSFQIRATKVASRSTADEILNLVARKQVEIPVEVVRLRELPDAFEQLEKGQVNGRLVVDLWG